VSAACLRLALLAEADFCRSPLKACYRRDHLETPSGVLGAQTGAARCSALFSICSRSAWLTRANQRCYLSLGVPRIDLLNLMSPELVARRLLLTPH
jgi:hypothetical protein